MIDRTQAPPYVEVDKIIIKEVNRSKVGDHNLFILNSGNQDAIRLQLVFNAGIWTEPRSQVARFTTNMLREGTASFSSQQIAETFDQQGAFLEMKASYDLTTITVYSLSKNLGALLPVLAEIVSSPAFPVKELEVMKAQAIQKHKIDHEKNSYMASTLFRHHLFGTSHPYGRNTREEDIQLVDSDILKRFHEDVIRHSKMDIHLAGNVTDEVLAAVEHHFGKLTQGNNQYAVEYAPSNGKVQKVVMDRKESMQSSLRMGCLTIGKKDDDFAKILVTNELLGGFFGSRLMKNIREDKGYTYGIYSQIVPLQHASYFVIGADVIKKSRGKAIKEIKKEIKNLINTAPEQEELQTVKNYIIGSFQSELNTAFALADKFTSIHYHGLDYSYYTHLIDTVRAITPSEISAMAAKYLSPDELLTVAVG